MGQAEERCENQRLPRNGESAQLDESGLLSDLEQQFQYLRGKDYMRQIRSQKSEVRNQIPQLPVIRSSHLRSFLSFAFISHSHPHIFLSSHLRSFLRSYFLVPISSLLILFLFISNVCCATEKPSVIAFMPSHAEILYAIGAQDNIAALGNFCDYPPAAAQKPKAGDLINPNIETVLALKPDTVILGMWKSSKTAQRLKKLGIKVVEIKDETSINDTYAAIRTLGEITMHRDGAEKLITEISSAAAAYSGNGRNSASVYIEVDAPCWSAGSGSYLSELLKLAGGKNIFDLKKQGYFCASWEQTVKLNPDIIISFSAKAAEIEKRPGAGLINAVKNGKIFDNIDRSIMTRPGPRIPLALEILNKILKK